jgi:hypothetical protein
MKGFSFLLLILPACFATAAWPQAQPQANEIITFDVPGAGKGAGQGTQAWGIVKGGWIQGDYIDAKGVYHGFLRAPDRTISKFDIPGMGKGAGQGAVLVIGMAPDREIVGGYYDAHNSYHGFLRNPTTGKIKSFECPGAGAGGTAAGAVNEAGWILAAYFESNGAAHGCLYNGDRKFIKYDPPDSGKGAGQGTYFASFSGINPQGEVVGSYLDSATDWHGFLRYADGKIDEFNDPNAGPNGGGTLGINAKGEIWGWYFDANNASHGYLTLDGKTFTEVDAPGAGTGFAQGTNACWVGVCFGGINPSGWVTGWYVDSHNVYHGFVRAPGGKITEFDVPGAGTGAWQGTQATAINPKGAITGHYTDAKGVSHGFLRLP